MTDEQRVAMAALGGLRFHSADAEVERLEQQLVETQNEIADLRRELTAAQAERREVIAERNMLQRWLQLAHAALDTAGVCLACYGSGHVDGRHCTACHGSGKADV